MLESIQPTSKWNLKERWSPTYYSKWIHSILQVLSLTARFLGAFSGLGLRVRFFFQPSETLGTLSLPCGGTKELEQHPGPTWALEGTKQCFFPSHFRRSGLFAASSNTWFLPKTIPLHPKTSAIFSPTMRVTRRGFHRTPQGSVPRWSSNL